MDLLKEIVNEGIGRKVVSAVLSPAIANKAERLLQRLKKSVGGSDNYEEAKKMYIQQIKSGTSVGSALHKAASTMGLTSRDLQDFLKADKEAKSTIKEIEASLKQSLKDKVNR